MNQSNTGADTMVLYHQHCPDGFGAAWTINKMLPEAAFRAMQYGDPVPDLTDFKRLYIVDFSLPRPTLEQLHQRLGAESVTLLDHHQTAMDELSGMPNCHIDLEHSGAVLAWQHCFPDRRTPQLLQYVQDRDLWKFELHRSRAVNAYIASWANDATFERWDELDHEIEMVELFVEVVGCGEAILRTQEMLITAACRTAQLIMVDGHVVPAVQSAVLQSEIGERLLEEFQEAPFAVIHSDDGEHHRYSLRSRPGGHNVAATCQRFDGGGHQPAAGFKTTTDRAEITLSPPTGSRPA